MTGVLTMRAADYPYLIFETADGNRISVSTESLSLTVSGNTLTTGNQSFALANLSRMYFSATDDSTTSICEALSVESEEITAIYDLQGRQVTKNQLHSGQVYVVRTKSGTHIIAIK